MKQLSVNHNLFWLCQCINRVNEYLTKKALSKAFAPVVKPEVEEMSHCKQHEAEQTAKPAAKSETPFVYGKTGTPINSLFI